MTSVVLRGGDIVDGRGGRRYPGDVWINDGRIQDVLSPGARCDAEDGVDISGRVICPGFIDMHAHSDLAVLADPDHSAKIAQGITTEVVGQDGLGYSPTTDESMAIVREQIAGWNGTPDLDYSWRSVSDYLARIDRGAPVNVAVLVPHGAVRLAVMGMSSHAATREELQRIRRIVADGLREGAVGMSTGLTYPPGMYASDGELIDALGAVHELGGYYCPHHRNYGTQVVEAYSACIDVAREADVPLHLTHCNVNFPQNQGRAREVLAAIDDAMAHGTDISLDSYPYIAGNTYLAALLPGWTHADSHTATLRLLADPYRRRAIIEEMEVDGSDGHHGIPMDWERIVVASVADPDRAWAVGKSIARMAVERGSRAGDLFADLLIADDLKTGCLIFAGNEENAQAIMRHRVHTVGTDGILIGDRPHPRGWGTFPTFLGHYARDLGLMPLEEAVSHATSRAARRLGLDDRGIIEAGCWADLVVLDPETVASPATYAEPTRPPIGIDHVFVNGEWALRDGARTSARAGRAVRRASPDAQRGTSTRRGEATPTRPPADSP